MASSNRNLTAADVMTASPRTCSTYSTVLEATMIFRDADCGAVPILDDGKPIGVLTDRDVALALVEHGENLGRLPVSDVMTRGVVSIAPTEGIEAVADQFADKAVRRLLVVDTSGQLVGIIAWADLVGKLSDERVGQVVNEIVDSSSNG